MSAVTGASVVSDLQRVCSVLDDLLEEVVVPGGVLDAGEVLMLREARDRVSQVANELSSFPVEEGES